MNRYATYKAVQKQPGGQQLVAFTRILHRTKPDILYNEVSFSLYLQTIVSRSAPPSNALLNHVQCR